MNGQRRWRQSGRGGRRSRCAWIASAARKPKCAPARAILVAMSSTSLLTPAWRTTEGRCPLVTTSGKNFATVGRTRGSSKEQGSRPRCSARLASKCTTTFPRHGEAGKLPHPFRMARQLNLLEMRMSCSRNALCDSHNTVCCHAHDASWMDRVFRFYKKLGKSESCALRSSSQCLALCAAFRRGGSFRTATAS